MFQKREKNFTRLKVGENPKPTQSTPLNRRKEEREERKEPRKAKFAIGNPRDGRHSKHSPVD